MSKEQVLNALIAQGLPTTGSEKQVRFRLQQHVCNSLPLPSDQSVVPRVDAVVKADVKDEGSDLVRLLESVKEVWKVESKKHEEKQQIVQEILETLNKGDTGTKAEMLSPKKTVVPKTDRHFQKNHDADMRDIKESGFVEKPKLSTFSELLDRGVLPNFSKALNDLQSNRSFQPSSLKKKRSFIRDTSKSPTSPPSARKKQKITPAIVSDESKERRSPMAFVPSFGSPERRSPVVMKMRESRPKESPKSLKLNVPSFSSPSDHASAAGGSKSVLHSPIKEIPKVSALQTSYQPSSSKPR